MSRRSFLMFGGKTLLTLSLVPGTLAALAGCRSEAGDQIFRNQRTVVDHAGREVTVPTPDSLERIYFTSALAQTYVFSLAPELQGGTALQLTEQELAFMPALEADLEYMGSMSGGGEIDREMLVEKDIQLIFSISGSALAASDVSTADDLQDSTGIPVVMVDGSFTNVVEAYRFVGDVMGCTERGQEVSAFLNQIYQDVTAAVADVKDEERVSLYYAEGPFGLATEPAGGEHAAVFDVCKARNVAQVELTGGIGMTTVSLESVIQWNPQVIVAWDDVIRGGADEVIRTNADWSDVDAVKNGRVYTMPNAPFAWCDRPPGMNRFLGLQWVANMLYPDRYDVDMVQATKEFFSKVYWATITDAQALELLGNSYPPYGRA